MSATLTNEQLTVLSGPTTLAPDVIAYTGILRSPVPGVRIPVRMTLLRDPATSSLVVYSPFDPSLVDVTTHGTVRSIVVPNGMHSLYAHAFHEAHPEATLYSSPGVGQRFPDKKWGTVLDESSVETALGSHVRVRVLTGIPMMQEVVLLHVASKTIVAADLAFNFSAEARGKMNVASRVFTHVIRCTRALDWSAMLKVLNRGCCKTAWPQVRGLVKEWEWDRFVPSHGEVVEEGAKEVFKDGMYKYVQENAEGGGVRVWTGVVVLVVGVAVVMAGYGWGTQG